MESMIAEFESFVRQTFSTKDFIPLHEPTLGETEKVYVERCLDSGFVSSVGKFVDQAESEILEYTGATRAIATMGTK